MSTQFNIGIFERGSTVLFHKQLSMEFRPIRDPFDSTTARTIRLRFGVILSGARCAREVERICRNIAQYDAVVSLT